MTAIELLHGFVNALNDRIEGAVGVVDDHEAFEAASKDIESLIRTELPMLKKPLTKLVLTRMPGNISKPV